MKNNYNIVNSFCKPDDFMLNPIVSRSTLRELSVNPLYAGFENFLHAVRMNMLIHGMDYLEALECTNKHDTFGYYKKIEEAGYNKKRLVL